MAIVTKNNRLNKISAEHEAISRSWAKITSDLSREIKLLKSFAAWRNWSFINDKGDLDQEDMAAFKAKFDELLPEIMVAMDVLAELNAMSGNPPEQFAADNDAFIAKYALNMVEFDKRYQG